MPFWPFNRRPSAANNREAVASILLGAGIAGNAQYPEDNYENYAREGYGRNEVVYACVREIYTSAAEGRLRPEDGKGKEIEQGPLAERLRNPNDAMEQFEYLERLNLYLDIAGIAYTFKERGLAGQPGPWHLLRPDRVTIVPGPRGPLGYLYTVNGIDYPIAVEDVGVVKLPNPFDDYYGLSPLHVLAKMVNLDASITDFNKMFFQNAGVPSGILKVKRKIRDEEDAAAIRSRFMSKFSGRTNWFKVPVLDEDADYQQIASTLKDMEMSTLRDIPESRICAVFNVPPVIVGVNVGLDASTYSNYETARQVLWHENLMPRNKLIRAMLRRFCREYDETAVLDWDYADVKALQEGEDARSARIVAQWMAGLISRDEAREALGYDPAFPGHGRLYVVPSIPSGGRSNYTGPDAPEPEPEPVAPPAAPEGAEPVEEAEDEGAATDEGKVAELPLVPSNGRVKVLV